MARQRFVCKWCGHTFTAQPWDKHGTTLTCTRAMCRKKSGIYVKSAK